MEKTQDTQPCIAILIVLRPDVAITVSRKIDPGVRWDGDAPDPKEDGYDAYEITVTARAICNGILYEGNACIAR